MSLETLAYPLVVTQGSFRHRRTVLAKCIPTPGPNVAQRQWRSRNLQQHLQRVCLHRKWSAAWGMWWQVGENHNHQTSDRSDGATWILQTILLELTWCSFTSTDEPPESSLTDQTPCNDEKALSFLERFPTMILSHGTQGGFNKREGILV